MFEEKKDGAPVDMFADTDKAKSSPAPLPTVGDLEDEEGSGNPLLNKKTILIAVGALVAITLIGIALQLFVFKKPTSQAPAQQQELQAPGEQAAQQAQDTAELAPSPNDGSQPSPQEQVAPVTAAPTTDADGDGSRGISDVVCLMNWVFLGTIPPAYLKQGDTTNDGVIGVADVVVLMNAVFLGDSLAP